MLTSSYLQSDPADLESPIPSAAAAAALTHNGSMKPRSSTASVPTGVALLGGVLNGSGAGSASAAAVFYPQLAAAVAAAAAAAASSSSTSSGAGGLQSPAAAVAGMGVPGGSAAGSKRDNCWLRLEICREFLRNKCSRSDTECKYAHPQDFVEKEEGYVVCCYDSLRGNCKRIDPPCKYLHPPDHLKNQLQERGRLNLEVRKNSRQIQLLQQFNLLQPSFIQFAPAIPFLSPVLSAGAGGAGPVPPVASAINPSLPNPLMPGHHSLSQLLLAAPNPQSRVNGNNSCLTSMTNPLTVPSYLMSACVQPDSMAALLALQQQQQQQQHHHHQQQQQQQQHLAALLLNAANLRSGLLTAAGTCGSIFPHSLVPASSLLPPSSYCKDGIYDNVGFNDSAVVTGSILDPHSHTHHEVVYSGGESAGQVLPSRTVAESNDSLGSSASSVHSNQDKSVDAGQHTRPQQMGIQLPRKRPLSLDANGMRMKSGVAAALSSASSCVDSRTTRPAVSGLTGGAALTSGVQPPSMVDWQRSDSEDGKMGMKWPSAKLTKLEPSSWEQQDINLNQCLGYSSAATVETAPHENAASYTACFAPCMGLNTEHDSYSIQPVHKVVDLSSENSSQTASSSNYYLSTPLHLHHHQQQQQQFVAAIAMANLWHQQQQQQQQQHQSLLATACMSASNGLPSSSTIFHSAPPQQTAQQHQQSPLDTLPYFPYSNYHNGSF